MEVVLKGRPHVEEEKLNAECSYNELGIKLVKGSTLIPSETSPEDTSTRPSYSNPKDSRSFSQEDQLLESAKAEMVEVREENERLKMTLTQIIKDYRSLQTQFSDIVQQQQTKKPDTKTPTADDVEEIVSLSLGTSSSGQKKEDKVKTIVHKDIEKHEEGLTLALDCKFEGSANSLNEPVLNLSPDNSFEELKKEDTGGPWTSSKTLKSTRDGDDEALQQRQVKKARVSVRTRCDGPTMKDGCQWRKYGQKTSKGNPCPRAYYRCTVAPACPVRKHVQRCAEDMSILITTYEGTHNHPLPASAAAVASTTTAAASMLISGSSASQPGIGFLASSSTSLATSNAILRGHSFSISDHLRSKQFYLPKPSISSTSSYPTITLDLTAPPSCSSQANQFNRLSSNFTAATPRYSSTSFNFSSSETSSLPTSWSSGYLNYGSQQYNKSSMSLSLDRQSQDSLYQSYIPKVTNPSVPTPDQHALTDTIAKAVTLDPKFQSALAAAISSYVQVRGGKNGGEGAGYGLKWGEHLVSLASSSATLGNGCATSYLNRSTGLNLNTQRGSLLLQSSLGFPSTKSASASPEGHNRGNIK